MIVSYLLENRSPAWRSVSRIESVTTPQTQMSRTDRYQHGGEKERERDTRTLRQLVSLWAANMIVTLFYRAKKTRGFCSRDVTTRLYALLRRLLFARILKSGGDVNFRIGSSRREYQRYCISRVFVSSSWQWLSKLLLSVCTPTYTFKYILYIH